MSNELMPSRSSSFRERIAAWAGVGPLLALAFSYRWVCDDALISFRYARHLAEGVGLRFNASEVVAVEGYSNLLWIVVLAPLHALGVDLVLASQVLSTLCAVMLVVLSARCAARLFDLDAGGTAAVSCVFGTLPSTAIWATSGLETMAFALALFATFERLDARRTFVAALCAIAATWLRADGFVWTTVVLAATVCARRTSSSAAFRVVFAIAGAFLAQLVLRQIVHGDWLPNTAHAKVGASAMRTERGFNYVVSFALAEPGLFVAAIAGVALGWRSHARIVVASIAVLGFALVASVYVGGDFMPYGRFLVPATAFVALLAAAAFKRVAHAPMIVWSCVALLIAISVAPFAGFELASDAVRQRFHFRWNRPDATPELAQWRNMRERQEFWSRAAAVIARHTQPGESMVLDAVGAVGFATELELFDIFGLVSPEVARRAAEPQRASAGHDLRVEPEFFLDRKPDYIGAAIVDSNAPQHTGLPPNWRTKPWAERLEIQRRPLEAADGFPPRSELRLFRLDWTR